MTQEAQHERVRRWMMAALDGELDPKEREAFQERLESDPSLRAEWDEMVRLKEVTREMKYKAPPEEIFDSYWDDIYPRLERSVGWILVSLGATVLLAWAGWAWVRELLTDTSMPLLVRLAALAVVAGLAILFVSVARERLFTWKRDPYKDVIR